MSFDRRRLRHRIEIQWKDEEADSSGFVDPEWIYLTTIWAAIEPISGREMLLAEQVQSKVNTRIIVNYRGDIAPSMRAKHNGVIYNIEAIIQDPDSGREWMTLQCSTGVNDG